MLQGSRSLAERRSIAAARASAALSLGPSTRHFEDIGAYRQFLGSKRQRGSGPRSDGDPASTSAQTWSWSYRVVMVLTQASGVSVRGW
jgi:hypothetical protein